MLTVRDLQAIAVAIAVPAPAPLADTMARMQFVQYDPIRSPANAQDLILRHRVVGYRCGDLAQAYRRLGLEEDYLHVYGAMTRRLRQLVHPRLDAAPPGPTGLASEVLAAVRRDGPLSARDVAVRVGQERARNDWGGMSAASTRGLEELQYRGLVRVAHRAGGVKVFEAAIPPVAALSPEERMRGVALHLVGSLAPLPHASLREALAQARRHAGLTADPMSAVAALLAEGGVEAHVVDGTQYLVPVGTVPPPADACEDTVRFVAPFDPLVWDRRRLALVWDWQYRFEAYTPLPKRRFGYYAMPIFFRDQPVGWVNLRRTPGGVFHPDDRYRTARPRGSCYRRAFEQEVDRIRVFLGDDEPSRA